MTSTNPSPADNLSQFEIHKQSLAALHKTNQYLAELLKQQTITNKALSEIHYLVNGFTSEGSSFQARQIDQFTAAYLAVLGPLVAGRLAKDCSSLPEMMKGAAILAKQLLEELAAYRSERSGIDLLEEMAAGIRDPFKDDPN